MKEKPTERSIDQTVEIDAPPDAVWKALTEAGELVKWYPLDAQVTPGEGGKLWYSWGSSGVEYGERIVVWEPNRHLRTQSLPMEGAPERPLMHLDYYLEGQGGRTTLRLVHSGFGSGADWDAEFDATNRGWREMLDHLRHYLERHPGKPARQTLILVPIGVSFEEAWDRLMGPEGLAREGSLSGRGEGDSYHLRAVTGDELSGRIAALHRPRLFGATVEAWNDARLWIQFETCGPPSCWFGFITYDLPDEQIEDIRARWTPALERLYA